jgi:hypothetical protein
VYECKRRAIDLSGQRVELTERQEANVVETANGGMRYLAPAKFFTPDGKQLIPEGHGFFRTAFGLRYKLVD